MKFSAVAGIDEAGRGPLAGPVVAAAVILPENYDLPGLKDSKLLSSQNREKLFDLILDQGLDVGTGIVSADIIDECNILQATFKAMCLAVDKLQKKYKDDLVVLVDGHKKIPLLNISQIPVIKGDMLVAQIAAASIIAKVTRDRMMKCYAKQYPLFQFQKHKGYPTKEHVEQLMEFGPTPIHRRSFAPVLKALLRYNDKKR